MKKMALPFSFGPAFRRAVAVSWCQPPTRFSSLSKASMRRNRVRRDRKRNRHKLESEAALYGPALRVALLGVPNTGKSTLFNRLTRQRRKRGARAIVNPDPGTTRDYREAGARIGDMHFELIDTGGLEVPATKHHKNNFGDMDSRGDHEEYGSPAGIQRSMLKLTESVLHDVDVVLLMLDGRRGVTPMDEHFARWVRKIQSGEKPVCTIQPVVNKTEGWSSESDWTLDLIADTHRLGFGDPVFISAEHGDGLSDLFDVLMETNESLASELEPEQSLKTKSVDCAESQDEVHGVMYTPANLSDISSPGQRKPDPSENVIQMCIVGRPNTGKSTLTNALIGKNRVLTGPTPGLTRDAIRLDMNFDVAQYFRQHHFSMPTSEIPERIRIIDTAGIRRPGKRDNTNNIENESVAESMHALKFSHVAVVVIDAQMPPTRMDLALIGTALDEGRALVIVANKIDLVQTEVDVEEICDGILENIAGAIPQARGAMVVPMSALHGHGIDDLFPACIDTYGRWDQRITTSILNQFTNAIQRHTPPPRGAKIRYISQVQHRPPKFVLFSSGTRPVPEHYERFLANSIRDEFDLGGVPIRLNVKAKAKRAKTLRKKQLRQRRHFKSRK